MNETITRAAGASHGQETSPELMEEIIRDAGRIPLQRTTSYGTPDDIQVRRSFGAQVLKDPEYTAVEKYERKGNRHKQKLVRPGVSDFESITSSDIV